MDSNTNNPGGEAGRVGGASETEPPAGAACGQAEQPSQAEQSGQSGQAGGANTTYIPSELRPTQESASYSSSGEPTRQWSTSPTPSSPAGAAPAPSSPPYTSQQQYAQDWRDKRRYRTPILGPVLLIAAGVLFLMNTMNIVPWGIWGQLWRLWPLILIAIGLDLLLGRRNPLVSLIVVLVVLAAGIGVIYAYGGLNPPGDRTQATFSAPLGSARSADVRIEMGAGQLSVDGNLDDATKLADGTLEYYGNNQKPERKTTTDDSMVHLTLLQKGDNVNVGPLSFFGGDRGGIDWEVHLNTTVPTTLNVKTGAGNSTLDLEEMKVTELDIHRGVGNFEVTLPASAGKTNVNVRGGVGNAQVMVPEGVAAHITVNSGIGKVNVDGFTKTGDNTYESKDYNSSAKNKVEMTVEASIGNVSVTSK